LAGGALTIGDAIVAGGDGKGVTLAAGGGIFNGMTGGTAVTGASATLKAGGAIGSTGAPLTTKVGELIATTTAAGSININEADTLTVTNATVANGSVVIVAGGATTVTSIVSNTNAAGRNVSVTVNSGDLTVGAIDAKTQGNVTLTASSGRILDDEALLARTTVIAGNAVTLTAAGGIGTAGANLDLAANSLTATVSGAGVMNLSQTGRALEATDVRTANGAITLASDAAVVLRSVVSETTSTGNAIAVTAGGHVDIGKVDAGASGDVAIVTTAGSVRAATGLPSTPALTADAVELTSAGGISLTAPAIGLTFNTLSAEVTGTGSIVIARPQATTFGTLTTAHGNIILQTAGAMTVTGAITAGKGGSIGLTATGSTVTLQGDVAGGGLSIAGGAVLTGTSRVIDTSAGTGGIAIGGALEASGVDVTLNAGGGAITLGGAVGATQRLGDLVLNSTGLTTLGGAVRAASLTTNAGGALALDGGVVDTTGAQNYGEAVTLGANTALTATTVSFGGAVDAATAGQQTLTVTGNAALNGAVGTTNALGALTVSGQTAFGHGTVTTTGAQGYNTAVLNAATKLTTANAAVSFAGAVDGGNTLTVNAGSGAITFSGAVGATQRLGAVTLNSSGATTLGGTVRAEGVTTNAGGTVALNGGSVDTTGLQSYGDAVTLGVNTTLIGNALFGGTVNAANAGQQTLTVTGDTVLNGAVGGTSALGALKIAGQTTFGHGAVTTSGAQGYGSALLSVATTLTASDAAVSFAGAVDGGKALTVNAGSGTITLGGAVGATQRLGAIVLNSTGATTFGGTVRAASVTTDAGGTVALNGGAVDTIGAQSYGEAATLGANMILTTANAAVTFGGTVDGARALTVNAGSGAVTLTSAVGSQTRLGAVTINSSGATILQGAVRAASLDTSIGGTLSVETNSIDTTGAQRYGERFVVRNDLTLQGSEVVFSGAVDGLTAGGQALAIVGGARFGGVVGADQALRSLSVSGATAFDGGRVVTTGAQQYGGAATLLRDTVLVAGGLAFGGTVDAASRSALTLDAGTGDVSVAGAVGANGTLGRVEIADATDVTFQGSVDATDFIQTNGSGETRLGAVRTDGATGIQLTGTRFTFAGPLVASGGKLSVDTGTTGGAVVFGANANVQTASGVSQSGTGPVSLASNISVQKGDIVFQSSVQLQGSDIRMSTDGLISLAGAIGPSTTLRLTSRTGGLVIGKLDGTSQEKADLGALIVDFASFGTVFGRIEGGEGGLAALRVRSGLRGEEYVANGTPWGYMPAASEVVAPTRTPGTATSLPGVFSVSNAAIDTLGAARAPEVLTTAGNIDVLGIGNSPQVLGAPRPAQPIGNQPTGSQPAGNQPTGSGPAPAAPAEQGGGQGGEQGSNGTNEDEAEAE
ncbi:MAG TPA: hypothetical protein VEH84_02240, partial [Alphaproteobacteria bacterium]|nr:hypothetical protein [Alphaproteobacteria bacterium]